jgi:hypothetical protein
MGMMLPLPVVRTAEERVLVVTVAVILAWTFGTMRVKATVKGVFTIAGADVEVADDFLVADVVMEVARWITIQAEAEEMDEEDETAVVFLRWRLGAGAISVVAVVETPVVTHEVILTNGEVMTYLNRL